MTRVSPDTLESAKTTQSSQPRALISLLVLSHPFLPMGITKSLIHSFPHPFHVLETPPLPFVPPFQGTVMNCLLSGGLPLTCWPHHNCYHKSFI